MDEQQSSTVVANEEAPVNDNQHVDLARIREFFTRGTVIEGNNFHATDAEYKEIGEMVLELCDLAESAGFLRDVAEVRAEMEAQDPDPETILPSEYRSS